VKENPGKASVVRGAGIEQGRQQAISLSEDRTWSAAIAAFFHRRVITMLFLGFSAGVPILLIFSTLSVWLIEADVERSTVTFFAWAALGYSFKFVWAPLVDKVPLPLLTARLGRRRAWILMSQLTVILSILLMASIDPQNNLALMAAAACLLGFSSATQDIVIDAYRIESADVDLQAMMSSSYIAGYRIGMLAAGAGTLYLAGIIGGDTYAHAAWFWAYVAMAAAMGIGVVTTLVIDEPQGSRAATKAFDDRAALVRFLAVFLCAATAFVAAFVLSSDTAQSTKALLTVQMELAEWLAGFVVEAVRLAVAVGLAASVAWALAAAGAVPRAMIRDGYVEPLAEFLRRYGKLAVLILALVGCYRVADIVLGVIANVFYIEIGFTKIQIALYAKTYGLFATIAGGFLGGLLAFKFGVVRILFVGAVLAAATNLLFAYMATQGADTTLFMSVIIADNLSGGLASAAFVAYLSSLTSISFTAMQYAVFSSLMTLLPKLLAGYSGTMVDSIGYEWFFIVTALLGIPVLILVAWIAKYLPPSMEGR
jgi:PAT family beta-lactamase induction signal transducer AmpG